MADMTYIKDKLRQHSMFGNYKSDAINKLFGEVV